MRRVRIARGWLLLVAWSLSPALAAAEQPPVERMREPTRYTSVADAFDEGDPFDFEFGVGFRRSLRSATIQRELVNLASSDGRGATRLVDVAEAETVTNLLELDLRVGIYRDLMLTVGLPLVLGQSHELQQPAGCRGSLAQAEGCVALREPVPGATGPDPELFSLESTLASKKRSGVPHVALGLAWGITNQYRIRYAPTWVVRGEARIGTGDVMTPCREGVECDPGISRGTSALLLESRWSHRFGFLEPLFGLEYEYEWVTTGDALFEPGGDLASYVDPTPPERMGTTLGLSIIAWEDRSRFQRFEVDTRARFRYVSSGRDFTPLFDALGTSTHPYLTAAQYDRLAVGALQVPFSGLSHVQAHGDIHLSTEFVMQAARYVRFALGFAADYVTPHLMTGGAPCNAGLDSGGDTRLSAGCSQGVYDPLHRPVIDLPGNRFRVDGQLTIDMMVSALGQF